MYGKSIRDSCSLKDATFSFKGNINGIIQAFLSVHVGAYKFLMDENPNKTSILLEAADIKFNAAYNQLKYATISGAKVYIENQFLQKEHELLIPQGMAKEKRYLDLQDQLRANDLKSGKNEKQSDSIKKLIEPLKQELDAFREKHTIFDLRYVSGHSNSLLSGYLLNSWQTFAPLDSIKKLYLKLNLNVKSSYYGIAVEQYILKKSELSAGKPAKNFTATDISGKQIKLSSFKGKIVLLDFWASWCAPCRASTPHLLNIYHNFHKSGLEVIAIASDDNAVKDWKKAVKQDKSAIWNNILEGQIGELYSISSLPTKILIDRNGVIVGRYSGNESDLLDKKISEFFN